MKHFRKSLLAASCVAILSAPSTSMAAWPERPIKLVVPFAAGGLSDVTARLTAERLGAALGQPMVIENEAGATGTIAAARVARSDPDGYTLFFCATNQIAIAPFTHPIAYDPLVDFVPVAIYGFAINLVTGVLFLFSDPFGYYPNTAFRLKLLAILLAGINAVLFKVLWERQLKAGIAEPGSAIRAIGAVSLFLWTSVIVFGRLIPYLS